MVRSTVYLEEKQNFVKEKERERERGTERERERERERTEIDRLIDFYSPGFQHTI